MVFVSSILWFLFGLLIVDSAVVLHKSGNKKLEYGIFYDNLPEEHMNVSQMIQYHGYPCENHEVVTEDGYILSLQRIPHGRKNNVAKKQAILLQHGLIDSAATWVNNLPTQSLGFILADLGYDVWLGNSRGNTYSRRHVKLSTKDPSFWNFSFDEMAKYDLPACIEYILKTTGTSQLYYAGHSQGTMMGFAEFGRNKLLASKIKKFFALAPVASVGHIKGALKFLSHFSSEVEFLFKILGVREFVPSNWLMKLLADVFCATHVTEKFCANIIFLMTGFDTHNLNKTRIPVYISHTPAGTSVKDIIHFVQLIKSGNFQMYDYGKDLNMKHYNQTSPPQYDISAVETPVALFSGDNDWLADQKDINETLKPALPNIISNKVVEEWNHMDFVWGEDAHDIVYKDMIEMMEN